MFKQLFVTFVLILASVSLSAQIKVTGKVTDEGNSPLPGANIIVKGTSQGVISDFDGNYEIKAKQGDVLEFSFVGFKTQSKKVSSGGNSLTINVVLQEDAQQLEDVVVVGFGTQKKTNLTGSVATVDTKILESRPVNNAVQALQGAVSGMNLSVGNSGGELNSNLNINIRGAGTIGSGSKGGPLVLIDGMEADLNTLNPQDIESVSVLKDAASASIYGSRAPFGVILVTTKSGKEGRIQINYNNSYRLNSPMNIPNMLDSENFAYYWNDAAANSGSAAIFRPEIIEKIKQYKAGQLSAATDWNDTEGKWNDYTNSWANVNWFKQFYRDWAPAQEHNLSVNGGNEKTNYYLSVNWLNQEGLIRYNTDVFDRYSVNAKISSQILPYLKINYNTRFVRTDYVRSSYLTESNGLFFHNIARRWPTLPVYDPNGNYQYGNEIAHLNNGQIKEQKDILTQQLAFIFTPIKGWSTNVELNYRINNDWVHSHWLPIYRYGKDGTPELASLQLWGLDVAGGSRVKEYAYRSNFFNPNIYTSYERQINDHYIKGLVGFQSELGQTRNASASRDGVYAIDVLSINTTGSANDDVSGEYQHWATAGLFGRLNYDYKGKYLLEGNIRYDGTSRFLKDQRWNTFTSASIGWNVAKEEFWQSLGKFGEAVSEFKFKASYGELGNQNTDNWYPFYPKMKINNNGNWLINRNRTNTASSPDLISTFLTWEKVASWNVGFDLSAFQNRLGLTFEVFQRDTRNMVGPAPQLPSTLGTNPPRINNTDMESKGFDIQLSWKDRIGEDFSYGISATLTDSRQRVTKYPNEIKNLNDWYDGKYSGEIWGYVTHGIAKTDQEMQDWLSTHNQSQLGSNWAAGDVMYEDLNGDGIINGGANTLSDSGDRKVIGNSTPRYNFGVNLYLNYKGLDFSVFLQGTGKRDLDLRGVYFNGANTGLWQSAGFSEHLDYFRPEGTNSPLGANVDAYYPRPLFDKGGKNFQTQTRWLQDGSYLRIKNIQLGYTFPSEIMNKIGVDKLRIYISAENVATFTKLSKIFDPEIVSAGRWGDGEYGKIYPLSRVISTGLSLTF